MIFPIENFLSLKKNIKKTMKINEFIRILGA